MADETPLPDPFVLIGQIRTEMATQRRTTHQLVQGLVRLTELTKALDASSILRMANAPEPSTPSLPANIQKKCRAFVRRR